MECYLAIKKEMPPFATMWIDLEGIILIKLDSGRQIPYSNYMWTLKEQTREQIVGYQRGPGVGVGEEVKWYGDRW